MCARRCVSAVTNSDVRQTATKHGELAIMDDSRTGRPDNERQSKIVRVGRSNVGKGVFLPREIGPTQCDGDDLGARRLKRIAHRLVGGEFSGADQKARAELAIGDGKR